MNDEVNALDRLFNEARQLPVSARAVFVERGCGNNHALRDEVLSLLAAEAASGAFMNQPALDRLARAVAREGWSIRSGDTIGPYTIADRLGVGGAGEVWRARDQRLRRDVAIKLLLPHFAADPDRLSRFADEARTAGALNHSNILTVYDIGDHHGIPYLVSEYVEGRSLRDRLQAGPLSVREILSIGLGLAEGLTAAHARGIVHRDLKPENTFLRADGCVKILDFGLAKLQASSEEIGAEHTMTGVIVGTAGYISPEQVRGAPVDGRADLFALGVMLHEMAARQHPFRCETTFDTLHAVLTVDPPELSSLNPQVPSSLERIVIRLLQRGPEARFQSAADVVWALQQVTAEPNVTRRIAQPSNASQPRWRGRWALVGAVVGAALTMLLAQTLLRPAARESDQIELTRFSWPLPPGVVLGSAPIVSPDSRYIAFVGTSEKDPNSSRLYVRDLSAAEGVIAVPGTENAQHPFWSPDTSSLGFFARGQLMKIAWPGGAPVVLAQTHFPFGAAWSRSGAIVFAPDVIMTGLRRVEAGGQTVGEATQLEMPLGDTSHAWPTSLPDGVHFLYFVRSAHDERRGVYIGRLDHSVSAGRMLLATDSNVVLVPSRGVEEAVMLSVANGRVEARSFDTKTLQLRGDPRTLAHVAAAATTASQSAMLSASTDMLVFATATVPYGNRLELVDRKGERLRLWSEAEAQNWPRVSPDGQLLARQRVDPLRNTPDVWVEDLARGTKLRVTTALEPDIRPVWSQDGRYLAFVSGNLPFRAGTRMLNVAAADGTGIVRSVQCPRAYCEPTDWTTGGLLVNIIDGSSSDVWMVPTDSGTPRPLLDGQFIERDARIAPNGLWIAYVSNESGRSEVSVRSISGPAHRTVVSSEGGDHPVWRRDGSELFFVGPDGSLRSVSVHWNQERRPTLGSVQRLNVPQIGRGHWGTPYDVSPDGERIFLLRRNDDAAPREIHVVMGWRALLR